MTLQDLKALLLADSIDESSLNRLFIFLCTDDNAVYLAKQYAHRMADVRGKSITPADRLDSITDSALALVMDNSDELSIIYTDIFDEIHESYDRYENCIVICKKLDKRLDDVLKPFTIVIEKPTDWQIKDYMSVLCPGLLADQITSLYDATKTDLSRIENELTKISLFPKEEQSTVFDWIMSDPLSDLFTYNIFDLQKNIALNKLGQVKAVLQHYACLDLDPIAFNNMLLTLFKKILYVNFKSGATLDQLNIKPAAAHYIQVDYSGLQFSRVANIIKFLSATDYKLKTGLLDMQKERLLDYIICNLALM